MPVKSFVHFQKLFYLFWYYWVLKVLCVRKTQVFIRYLLCKYFSQSVACLIPLLAFLKKRLYFWLIPINQIVVLWNLVILLISAGDWFKAHSWYKKNLWSCLLVCPPGLRIPHLEILTADCVFIEKHWCISGHMQFEPVWFKGSNFNFN